MGDIVLMCIICVIIGFAAGMLIASYDGEMYLEDEEIDEEIKHLENLKRRNQRRRRRREGDKHGQGK